ncbi:MAG: hypothetical protein ACJAT2_002513 [Bacteriovoracaceae bacterium]|jgi:hypothetical protein
MRDPLAIVTRGLRRDSTNQRFLSICFRLFLERKLSQSDEKETEKNEDEQLFVNLG